LASGIRVSLRRVLAGTLALASLLSPLPAPRAAVAATYVTDSASHPPPTSGPYAYYATAGTFGPNQSGFPGIGGSFVDPVFGRTIRRLTNEVGQSSDSEIYSRNGWSNADGTLVHHRSPNGRKFINPKTGQVVKGSGIPGNFDSSFAPDDPDTWYYWNNGSSQLMQMSVASGQSSVVHNFPGALSAMGGSVDWIDRSGRYMVLRVGGNIRVFDKQTKTLYSGSIPGSYGGGGGWTGISPDGQYVITSTPTSAPGDDSHSWKINHSSQSVSTSPVLYWTLCGGHADIVSASNGKTYHVSLDCHTSAALYAADVSIPQSAGNVPKQLSDNKKLVQLTWSDDVHVSRVSKGDWAAVSVESGGDGFTSSVSGWRAYKQEILMANVVTGEVRRLAHHRSRGDLGANYFAQPRVSSSWDGSMVFWTSNFGHSQNGYSDLYVVETGLDGSGGTPPPPPATLAASFSAPAAGATVSGTTSVGMSATGGSGSGYSYVLKVDGTTVSTGPASYSWNTTSVANGSHTLSVTVTDGAGATATTTRTVTVSNTSATPTLNVGFSNPASGATVSGTVTVTVTAASSTGGAGAAAAYTYTVKAGTATIYSGANGTFSWNTTSTANGATTLTATVTDGTANGSATRNVTVSNGSTPPPPPPGGGGDTTAPTVNITTPTGNVWTGNSINIVAAATDNVGLSKIELWGNGVAFRTVTCTGSSCNTGTVWWSTGPLTGAAYQVHAVAYDTAGNKTLSAPRTIYKNGTSPVIASGATGGSTTPPPPPPPATITASFTSPAAGATVSGTVTVGMSVSGGTGSTTFTLTNGGSPLSTQTVSGATASFAWNTTGVANGGTTLTLTAVRDGATSTVTRNVTVSNTTAPPPPPPPPPTGGDTTKPTVRITKPGNNAWTGNSLDVAATATDNVKLASIKLYGNGTLFSTTTCTSTSCGTGTVWWSTRSLGSGKHTLKAVATDAAGNTAETSITINK